MLQFHFLFKQTEITNTTQMGIRISTAISKDKKKCKNKGKYLIISLQKIQF